MGNGIANGGSLLTTGCFYATSWPVSFFLWSASGSFFIGSHNIADFMPLNPLYKPFELMFPPDPNEFQA